MNEPYERNLHGQHAAGIEAGKKQNGWPHQDMEHIVGDRANARAGKVAQHRKVRCEKKQRKKRPGTVDKRIEGDRDSGHEHPLDPNHPFEEFHQSQTRLGRSRTTMSTLTIFIPSGGSGMSVTRTGPATMSKILFSPSMKK